MEQEIWKVYKETNSRGWHRVYEVSDQGNVKINGELVDFSNQKRTYYEIGSFDVHRAVAELFVPNPDNKPCIDHINTDKYDNRAVNLQWCTQKENCNNLLTRKHQSEANTRRSTSLKEAYKNSELKAKKSVASKDRSWMTNGIDRKFVKPELVDYYLEKGYHFGMK